MDRGGRLSGTLNLRQAPEGFTPPPSRFAHFIHRFAARTGRLRVLRGIEIVFVAVLLAATALYGAIRGGHADAIMDSVHDVADAIAQRAGFQSANVAIEGANRLSRADVLRVAGITESSTLFLIDADATRTRLLRNSWNPSLVARITDMPHARSLNSAIPSGPVVRDTAATRTSAPETGPPFSSFTTTRSRVGAHV